MTECLGQKPFLAIFSFQYFRIASKEVVNWVTSCPFYMTVYFLNTSPRFSYEDLIDDNFSRRF